MKALIEFHNSLDALYGYYAEVETAIACWHRYKTRRLSGSGTSDMLVGRGDSDLPNAEYQHQTTAGASIAGTGRSGRIPILHRRYILVLIVAAWEDGYRGPIARECNKKCKKEIESDVFHDLNKYRQGVLHASGRLDETPKVLSYFAKGDEVSPTSDQIDLVFQGLADELNRIGEKYYGQDPGLVFSRKLHEPTQTSQQPERTAT